MRSVPAILLLGACAGKEGDTGATTACGGEGDPTLLLGTGSRDAFVELADGETVALLQSGDQLAVSLSLLTTGLDTSEPVTAVVNVTVEGHTGNAIASLSLQCPSEGPGWVSVTAPLPNDYDGADPATLSGLPLTLDATATDGRGITAGSDPVTLTVE